MKKLISNIIFLVSVLLIVMVVIYGMKQNKKEQDVTNENVYLEEDDEVYYLDKHTLSEFSDVIIDRFHQESNLVVSCVDTTVSVDLKQTGIFDLDILNKTQRIIYQGTGRFYVDLSRLGEHSIHLDNNNFVITIEIPHTELAEIEIDPDKFDFEETRKGLLAFGDLKFTAKEYNNLETECKKRMEEAIDTMENRKKADERAKEEMTKIYEPIVKAVDDAYQVTIVFLEK